MNIKAETGASPYVASGDTDEATKPERHEETMKLDDISITHRKLDHAVTDYDRKQSTKRGYNIYALSHYLGAVQNVTEELHAGNDLRESLVAHFSGRLLDVCLRAVGLETSTKLEQMGSL